MTPYIEQAREAAIAVLLHNRVGNYHGLPRTAGWGYPEPYTRDLLLAILGIAVTDNKLLHKSARKVLETLALHQSSHGHIPSLVHDPDDRGASDTTPLFLLATGIYRQLSDEKDFLENAVQKSLAWMRYQSPSDRCLVAQLPTTDWRDEQWTIGYALYVNTLVYSYLRLLGHHRAADDLRHEMRHFTITAGIQHRHVHEGLTVKHKPYYAFWSYKIYSSERFDLLGNSLAILAGIASPARAVEMVDWIEEECRAMRAKGELAMNLPPNFFPYVRPGDPDWHERYEIFNQPGNYHNGGIWPFICSLYIAALVAAKKMKLATEKLEVLTALIKLSRNQPLDYGFNEWIKAQDGRPMGQNWQTWSAALYLYAVKCVELGYTPFFDKIRAESQK
ncbi:glycoside hydrolase 100 family protein [Chitinophaga vietnamensis]|uniref:glycoside hydrolase 100 family protein n=1 Tax=Chitinophaga vietnamensis TaxID=2593957 RepID=UPI001177F8AD|nr:glycoside hydrolase 100 family protein [Chitinophaga vietnamensis]